jgi:hypothetical protein
MDVHRNHHRLQQLLQEQQALQQQGQAVNMDAQICPVKRQMEVVLGGVDDTVGGVFSDASLTLLPGTVRLVIRGVGCKRLTGLSMEQ